MQYFDSIFSSARGILNKMTNTDSFDMKMHQVLSTLGTAIQLHDDFSNLLIDSSKYGRPKHAILRTAQLYDVILPEEFIDDSIMENHITYQRPFLPLKNNNDC